MHAYKKVKRSVKSKKYKSKIVLPAASHLAGRKLPIFLSL